MKFRTRFRSPFRLVMIVLALVFMASLVVFISLFDINRYHDQLEAGFSVALGRQLTIEGPLEFHLSLSPSLIAHNVRIANLPWASQPAFFHSNRVEIQVSLIPLLNRELIIDHLIIEDGGLFFEEGTEGVDNWTFRGDADQLEEVPVDESLPLIEFGGFAALTVQRSTISFFSHSNETTYQVEIDDGSIVEISEKLDKYVIEGSFRDVPIALDLVGGKIFEMGSHTDSWPLDGTIRTAGSTLALRGEFLGSNQEGSFDFNLGLKGDRLSSLNSLIGQDLPAIGPYTFSAKVSDSEKELHVENLKARIKNSHLTGNLTLSTQGLRTQVQASLTAGNLQFDDFGGIESDLPQGDSSDLIATLAILMRDLQDFDADLDLQTKSLIVGDTAFQNVQLRAKLQEGLFKLHPFRARGLGGTLIASLEVDGRNRVPKTILKAKAQSMNYGEVLQIFGGESGVEGTMDLEVFLSGEGAAQPEFLQRASLQLKASTSNLVLNDTTTGEKVPMGIRKATAVVSEGGPVKIGVEGSVRDKPVLATLTTGTLSSLFTASNAWPINLSARTVDASLVTRGTVTSGPQGIDFGLAIALKGGRLNSLDPDLPAVGPYRLEAKVTKQKDQYMITAMKARVASSDIGGQFNIMMEAPKPRVTGSLMSQHIKIEDFITPGDFVIPVDGLRSVHARLDFQAERVEVSTLDFGGVAFLGKLDNGILALETVKGTVLDKKQSSGTIKGSVELNAADEDPTLSGTMNLEKLDYGRILKNLRISERIRGMANFQFKFSGNGSTIGTMVEQSSFDLTTEGVPKTLYGKEDEGLLEIFFTEGRVFTDPGGLIRLKAGGKIKEKPFHVLASAGRVKNLIDQRGDWPLKLSAGLGTVSMDVEGKLRFPLSREHGGFRIALKGERLSELDLILGSSLPDLEPFSLSGFLVQTKQGFRLEDFQGRLAGSDVSGTLALNTDYLHPRVIGKLASNTIEFSDRSSKNDSADKQDDPSSLQTSSKESPTFEEPDDSRLIPDISFPVDTLRSVDVDLDWQIEHVRAPRTELGELKFKVMLEDGLLTLAPFKGTFWGGQIEGNLEFNAASVVPTLAIKATTVDLDIGLMLSALEATDQMMGNEGRFRIDLRGRGMTLREMMSRANGQVEIVEGPFELKTEYIDLWATGLVVQALTAAWDQEEVTKFNCAVGYFDVNYGVMKSAAMLFDSTRVTIAAVGTLDFGSEEVDLVATPKPKDPALLSLAHPVRLTGKFSDPDVTSDPLRIAESGGWGLLGLVNPFGLVVAIPGIFGTTLGTGEDNPCVAVMEGKHHTTQRVEKIRGGIWGWVKRTWQSLFSSSEQNGSD